MHALDDSYTYRLSRVLLKQMKNRCGNIGSPEKKQVVDDVKVVQLKCRGVNMSSVSLAKVVVILGLGYFSLVRVIIHFCSINYKTPLESCEQG